MLKFKITKLNFEFSLDSSLDNYEVCMTKDCVTAASTLIQSMDAEIDPCENFYSFACGGFIDNTNIPQEKHGVSTMSKMQVIFTGATDSRNLLISMYFSILWY